MRWRFRAATAGFLASLTFAASARAEDSPASVVWYRASEECPSGSEFLARLAGGAPRARLAAAGDHIDFVVTLVAAHDGTVGRLERQTQGGTVAIRELRDASCERVADALALSLGLALGPSPLAAPAAVLAAPADEAASAPAAAKASAPSASAEPPPVAAVDPPPVVAPVAQSAAVTERERVPPLGAPRWSIGVDGGVLIGVAPSALPHAAAFVDVEHAFTGIASELSLRFAFVGARGSTATAVGPVQQWIAAGRGEVCPLRWGGARAGLRPCVDFELGATSASETSAARASRQRASSLWAAPGVGLRADAAVLPKLTLELGALGLIPLARSEVAAGSERLYRAEFAALIAYAGVSVGPF